MNVEGCSAICLADHRLRHTPARSWRNIAITLIDLDFGEQTAQAGDNACLLHPKERKCHLNCFSKSQNGVGAFWHMPLLLFLTHIGYREFTMFGNPVGVVGYFRSRVLRIYHWQRIYQRQMSDQGRRTCAQQRYFRSSERASRFVQQRNSRYE